MDLLADFYLSFYGPYPKVNCWFKTKVWPIKLKILEGVLSLGDAGCHLPLQVTEHPLPAAGTLLMVHVQPYRCVFRILAKCVNLRAWGRRPDIPEPDQCLWLCGSRWGFPPALEHPARGGETVTRWDSGLFKPSVGFKTASGLPQDTRCSLQRFLPLCRGCSDKGLCACIPVRKKSPSKPTQLFRAQWMSPL